MTELLPILFAEDNPNDTELTLKSFAENNLINRVTHVKDGVEAMEYLRCEGKFKNREPVNPALAILDIKMPRMNGIYVLRAIRADPNLKWIPVVLLTSSQEEQDIVQSYKLGINAYIVKPVTFSDFTQAVNQVGVFWAILNEPPPKRNLDHDE